MPRLILLAFAAMTLAGCTGVIDRCAKGLDPPPGGFTGRH